MKTLLVMILFLVSSPVFPQLIVKNYCNRWENSYKEKGKTETVFTWNLSKNTVKQKTDGKTYETLTILSVSSIATELMMFNIDKNDLGITKIVALSKNSKRDPYLIVYYGEDINDPFIVYYINKTTN